MTRKVYRTAQGKMVDIGALQLRNENVRAVGNMAVNARGDLVDHMNRPIEARTQQVAKSYRRQTGVVSDTSVHAGQKEPKKLRKSKTGSVVSTPAQPQSQSEKQPEKPFSKPLTGLAAAIAKARQIKQEELTNPQQVAEHQRRNTES